MITLPETNMEIQKGPIKTTVLLKGDYMGFHVSLGECKGFFGWEGSTGRLWTPTEVSPYKRHLG